MTPPSFRKDRLPGIRRAALGKTMRPVPAQSDVTASDGLQTLRDAPTAIREFLDGHRAALADAHRTAATDPNLSEDGRAARHGELRQAAQQAATARVAELRNSVDQAANAVQGRAASARPMPATGVEAMMGRQVHWNRTKEMLDGGVPLHEVIGEAVDPEALYSMRDELPSYLRVKGYAPEARTEVVRTVNDQLANVAGGKALDAHNAWREAEQHVAHLSPLLDHAEQVAGGHAKPEAGMVSAIRAEHAARQRTPQPSGPAA
jgi:hypothetical protein